ncbi:MAG: DUF3987 domain-containing protein [candidate division NC10 bacterium]|nr:DUF3987 domain-containing protein [candidate division NC10 bacterium]
MEEKLLDCDELAAALNLRPATIRRWTYARSIPAVRVGKRAVRYRLRDVERVLLRDEPARATGGGAMTAMATITPHNIEAETSVLGGCLQDAEAARTATAMLTPSDFFRDANRRVFAAIQSIVTQGEVVNVLSVYRELERRDASKAKEIGPTYLHDLWEQVVTAANVAQHCRFLREDAGKRRLLDACTRMAEKIRGDGADLADLVAEMQEQLNTLTIGGEVKTGDVPSAWPALAGVALHGLAGEIVRAVQPWSEADPVGILVHLLVAFGNLVGRGPHFTVESTRHGLNLFAVLVGPTAAGRKGQAWSSPRYLCSLADESWVRNCVKSGGLSSGEGLIYAVRDPSYKSEQVREKGRPTGQTVEVLADTGVEDKKLFVLESEFAQVLKVGTREGNILSPIMRQAWDGVDVLAPLTKTCPTRATGAHISVVGHITQDELLRHLTEKETANGWANRFLWFAVQRSKFLPDGEPVPEGVVRPLADRLTEAVSFGRTAQAICRDLEATALWRQVYRPLSEGRPGLVGAILGRAEAQTMRLACVYALLDGSFVIRKPHLLAALGLWDYVEESARYIFGDRLGDSVADQALSAIRQAGKRGLTQTELHHVFRRNVKGGRLIAALQSLVALGLIRPVQDRRPGG